MGFHWQRKTFFMVIGFLFFFCIPPAGALDFPTKPISFICPWPAGGATDVSMRVLAEEAGKYLGQPVIVENKPGASGTVAPAAMAATAKADGYNLAQISITVFRFPSMLKVSYDPLKDFTYIIQISGWTLGAVVKNDSPWKTWKEFVAYARSNPNKVTYATPGTGSTCHLVMEKIARMEGVKWVQVPMKGGGESTPAVLGGHVTATVDSSGWAPQVDAGLLRVLVTWGTQRTKRWPQVPTLKEQGYNIIANSPWGIAGPKGMDPRVVKILHDAFKKAMDSPAFQKIYDKYDIEPFYLNSTDYVKYAQQLYEEEREMVEMVGLKKK